VLRAVKFQSVQWAARQYTLVRVDGFSEQGSLLQLHIHSNQEASLRTDLGARATYAYGDVIEFAIGYPEAKDPSSAHHGSTHEITYHPNGSDVLWATGQKYDTLVKLATDAAGRLRLTLEFAGKIARLDENGNIVDESNVCLNGDPSEINTRPHGLGIGGDGETIWFTGKATGTVGKISPDGKVQHFALPSPGSVPIYIRNGPDHNMWATELVGNAIARITPGGNVAEFPIRTSNSRPIAIVPEPGDGTLAR
jgi:virginiamycin B lyase